MKLGVFVIMVLAVAAAGSYYVRSTENSASVSETVEDTVDHNMSAVQQVSDKDLASEIKHRSDIPL